MSLKNVIVGVIGLVSSLAFGQDMKATSDEKAKCKKEVYVRLLDFNGPGVRESFAVEMSRKSMEFISNSEPNQLTVYGYWFEKTGVLSYLEKLGNMETSGNNRINIVANEKMIMRMKLDGKKREKMAFLFLDSGRQVSDLGLIVGESTLKDPVKFENELGTAFEPDLGVQLELLAGCGCQSLFGYACCSGGCNYNNGACVDKCKTENVKCCYNSSCNVLTWCSCRTVG